MSISALTKPSYVFGRDDEWAALTKFVGGALTTQLGVVYGRRRQGKTVLLDALCEQTGGFVWQARQQSSAQNLLDLSNALARFVGHPPRLDDWEAAIAYLLDLERPMPNAHPLVVAIDEVGYLIDADPAFPSRLQAALSPAANRGRRSPVRLILCGSAFGQMRALLDSDAPLRGRAQLDLVVRPFRFQQAADYWGLGANPDAAFRLHALIGGTPAYRVAVGGDAPKRGNIDGWVVEHLLEPTSSLLREGRINVFEDPSLSDRSLYWSLLGAIASGATRPSEIAHTLGRQPTSLHHALGVLEQSGWVEYERDPLRERVVVTRSTNRSCGCTSW